MKVNKYFLIFIGFLLAGGTVINFLAFRNSLLAERKADLEDDVSQTRKDFAATAKKLGDDIRSLKEAAGALREELASTTESLARTTAERNDFEARYDLEKARMDEFYEQISSIRGTAGKLEKLSETDPELLRKYSKVYFLNENYVPKKLARIDADYAYNPKEDYYFNSDILPYLSNLLSAAKSDEIDLKIISAYRSFGEQSSLKSSYRIMYGSGANRFSADQGYSEHQLGTTVDFTTSEVKASYTGFEKTSAYDWLLENAHKYGFILSYPKGNQYYQYEPWHWRFVGRLLAQKTHEDGENFYDLDQREINKFLISFFD